MRDKHVRASTRHRTAALRLVLLGPPGSGKGTLAKQLEERRNMLTMSTGDIFRREIKAGSRLGKQVSGFVTQGLLVPDELVVSVMTKQLTPRRLRSGFALDGFPRTVGQADGLNRFLLGKRRPLHAAIYLYCSPAVLVRRLSGRRVCGKCGAIYHLRNVPPARAGSCDKCGGTLITRRDDRPATIRRRLAVDRKQVRPLLDYYRRLGLLHRANGSGTSEPVYSRVMRLFRRQGWSAHDRA